MKPYMKPWAKITLGSLAVLFALTVLILAFLPTWISSDSGKKTVLKWINGRIDGTLSIDRMDLNWFGHQRIENLSWVDPQGQPIFSVKLLETETSLAYLALGGRSLGRTVIQSPYLNLTEEVVEKIQQNDEKKEKKRKKSKRDLDFDLPRFSEALHLQNGTVIFSSPKISKITIEEIQVEKKGGNDCFHVTAQTNQANQSGSIDIQATCGRKLEAEVKINQFPLASLNELEGSTLITDALGPTLSSDLKFEKEAGSSLNVHGTITSAYLNAYVEGSSSDHKFSLSPKTHLELSVTPALFKTVIDEKERKNWDLASKTLIKADVEKAIFPLEMNPETFKEIILQAKVSIDRAELHHQELGSYSLKGFQANIISQQNLEISYSGEILGKEQTQLSGTISITPHNEILFQYNYQGFPVSLLSLVSSDLEKNVRALFGHQFNLENQGTYQDGEINSTLVIASPQTQLTGDLTGTLPKLHFSVAGNSAVSFEKTKFLGKNVNFTLAGNLDLTDQQIYVPTLKGNVSNEYFSFDIRGKLGEKGLPFEPESLQLIGTGVLNNLPILELKEEGQLKNTTAYLQVDGSKNLILLKTEGSAFEAILEMHDFIKEGHFEFDQADTHFYMKMRDFPTHVLSSLFSDDLDLNPLIGNEINLNARGSYSPAKEPRFTIDMDAEGEGFAAVLSVALDGTLTVQQRHPSYIYWDISPARYEALMRHMRVDPSAESTFVLTRTTKLQLDITQFTCPTTSPKDLSHFLCQSGFVGKISLGTTNFKGKWSQDAISFQGVTGSLKGENFSKGIDFSLKGNILAANIPESEKSSFSCEGQLLNFWTQSGHFNREGLTVKGVLDFQLLPVRQMSGLFPLDHETRALVQAVLGELMNAHVTGEITQMAGPITIDVKASNFKTTLPLLLQRDHILLREYVDAEITLTQAVNETLLRDINPLFIAGAYSEHPLRLYIEPEGFFLPIKPFSLQGLRIGRAMLDIGKIRVRNGGQVQYLVNFLQAKEISYDGLMEAWFTPIYFSLQNGVASYNRFDALLAGSIHIAMWGSINLITNQVSMTLGIAPSTIAQRFKISGLGKQNMFQVKMSGTTDKLDLDWSAASTRIAFLVARSATGGLGMLIGGLLEPLINSSLGEDPVPPPTTPLPWENLFPSDPAQLPQDPSTKKGSKGLRRLTEFLSS